jgi:hypothetical protein
MSGNYKETLWLGKTLRIGICKVAMGWKIVPAAMRRH